jgi:hypothetical protein
LKQVYDPTMAVHKIKDILIDQMTVVSLYFLTKKMDYCTCIKIYRFILQCNLFHRQKCV